MHQRPFLWLSRSLRIVARIVARLKFSGASAASDLAISAWFCLAPMAGFEPATNRLTAGRLVECQTAVGNHVPHGRHEPRPLLARTLPRSNTHTQEPRRDTGRTPAVRKNISY